MEMKVKKSTIIRTAVLLLAIINNGLALFGKSPLPIDDVMVEQVVSFLFTTGSALVAWWKNNSFTSEAINADGLMMVSKNASKELKKLEKNFK